MRKQIRILLAGVLVVAPFAVTVWAIVWIGGGLDRLVQAPLAARGVPLPRGLGIVLLVTGVYLIGLLAQFWIFRWVLSLLEKVVVRVPGIKTIYESVRDLMMLFGGNAGKMGKVVLYTPPGTNMTALGIRTNERPAGAADAPGRNPAAVYLPFSYMFGGITVYVPAASLREIDMPVETCLKLCATAFVTSDEQTQPADQPPAESGDGKSMAG